MNIDELKKYRYLFILFCITLLVTVAKAANNKKSLPVFDAHIHYSHDVWDAIPPKEAIRRLREIGVKRALVSSTSDEGTQMLYRADPSFVVPSLRPYRQRGTLDSWMYDESVIPYIKERLDKYYYAAIGELHIDGEQAYTPVMQEIIRLAKKHRLVLHVHGDAQAVEFIFKQNPDARILWAHAGFDYAVIISKLMDKYPYLWADLSFRGEIINEGRVTKAWKNLLVKHADRFLLGIDTYTPQRWLQISDVMKWKQELLAALPGNIARKIAYENGEHIFRNFDNKP